MVRILVLIFLLASAQAWGCAGQKSTAERDRRSREDDHKDKLVALAKCGSEDKRPEAVKRAEFERKVEAEKVAAARLMAERAAAEKLAREAERKATVERATKP